MALNIYVKIGDTISPSVPFLWYREQELTCPVDSIKIVDGEFVIVQRHVIDAHVYICAHSLVYYMICKGHIRGNVCVVPINYNKNFMIDVIMLECDGIDVEKCKLGRGHIMIHDSAYSPCGYPYIVVGVGEKCVMKCKIVCEEVGIDIICNFVLINEVD